MGFNRHLKRTILPVALLFGETSVVAASLGQPGWTPLPDPNGGFVAAERQASSHQQALDRFMADFSLKIAQAIAVEQQENEARCKASAAIQHGAVRSADWQASCGYRRY